MREKGNAERIEERKMIKAGSRKNRREKDDKRRRQRETKRGRL
jgi:hypothetical protein